MIDQDQAADEGKLEHRVLMLETVADSLDRYRLATEQEALHRAAARRMVELRAMAALELHENGASYRHIAGGIGLTRARAQQLVQQGRALREEAHKLGDRRRAAGRHAERLAEQTRLLIDRGRQILAESERGS